MQTSRSSYLLSLPSKGAFCCPLLSKGRQKRRRTVCGYAFRSLGGEEKNRSVTFGGSTGPHSSPKSAQGILTFASMHPQAGWLG